MAAEVGFSTATIVSEKVDQPAKSGNVGAIVDCSAVLLRDDQASAGEYGQVVRHRVVRNFAEPRDFAREKALRDRPTAAAAMHATAWAAPARRIPQSLSR
jgi:hypothetical protein